MLRIIKGRRGIFNWAGYIISLALSLYTFYFSALLIFSQFAYIVIFMRRDKKLVFKWFMSLVLAFLIFAPWLPSALTQFHNASSISFDWSDKGFNVGFLRFGLYARNLVSVAGLDPSFMVFPGGVQAHFSKTVLAAVAAAVSAAFALLFYAGFIFLKERSKDQVDSRVLWLPFWLVFLPLLLSWLAAGLFNMLPNARYLTVMHSMFLMLIAASIGYLWSRNRRVSILALVLVVLLFASRIPAAVSTEFEYRESVSFLKDNIAKDDRIICVIPPPDVSLAGNVVVIDEKYADLNAQKSAYLPLPGQVWQDIRKKIRSRHRVWFYRPQGHFELFGLYSQIDSFLKDEGYKAKKTYRFRNIDIIELETRG